MIENYTVNKFFRELAKELLGENTTQQQLDDYVNDLKNKFENFQQQLKNKEKNEFEPYKEEARKILAEYNIQATEDQLVTFAALFCARNSDKYPREVLTKYQQQHTNHINELIDKLDNEYKGNIKEIVEKYNTNTDIDDNFVENFPLKTDSTYINEEDLSIIYIKSVCPTKTSQEVEVIMDTYTFNDEENYVYNKNQYRYFDFSKFCKQYTTEKLTLYREISKEQTFNIINNIITIQNNIKTMQEDMKDNIKAIEDIVNTNINNNIIEIKKLLKNLIKNAVLI